MFKIVFNIIIIYIVFEIIRRTPIGPVLTYIAKTIVKKINPILKGDNK